MVSSVGFSFIFSWVLMGVVVTTFVVGGNIEKLVCEPLANRQIFKVLVYYSIMRNNNLILCFTTVDNSLYLQKYKNNKTMHK